MLQASSTLWDLTLASERPSDPGAVLNGIAYRADSNTFVLAGKLWPRVFEIRLVD